MGGSTDSWDESEMSISDYKGGEIQLDTRGRADEVEDEITKRLNGARRFREAYKGLMDKINRDSKEVKKKSGLPPTTPLPPKPVATTASPDAQSVDPSKREDSPEKQGAPDLATPPGEVLILTTEGPSPRPVVSSDEPSFSAFDQSNPLPPDDIAKSVFPSVPDADFAAFVQRILRNEPQPGQKHPTHSAPAARIPAADADPVHLFSGAFTVSVVDIVVPTADSPITLSRSYRSGLPYYGPFGFGWDHEYNVYLRELSSGNVAWWTGRLQEQQFHIEGDGSFTPPVGLAARLERKAAISDQYRIIFPGGKVCEFERPSGWSNAERIPLTLISDRHGNSVRLAYNTGNQLLSVLDSAGRGLFFQYGSCDLLEQVTDHTRSRTIHYWHDNEIEHLVHVVLPPTAQYPQGLTTTYEYDSYADHPAMRHNILRIHDTENRLMVENEFAGPQAGWEFNSVVRQRLAGFEYQFEYQQIQYVWPDPLYVDVLATRTLVRRPDGSLHTYTFNFRGDLLDYRFRLIRDGSLRIVASQSEHDAEGNVIKAVGPDGLRTFYTYDTANPDPCAHRNLLRIELAAPLSGILPSRIVYQAKYEPRYQLLSKSTDEIGAETRYFYDSDTNPAGTGRLTRIQHPVVTDADGNTQQSEVLFEHNAKGQPTALVKPGGRTELAYVSGGLRDGFLSTVTRDPAVARLITTFEYDTAGFAKEIVSPGGRTAGFTHNAQGQVEQIDAPEVNGLRATMRRWYDDSGSVVREELPAGSSASQLVTGTSIVDEFERDETGNLHCVKLAANTNLKRSYLQRVDHEGRPVSLWDESGVRTDRLFGEDGALLSETLAAGDTLSQTSKYTYDSAGRITSIAGPWQEETTFRYDLWGRLDRVTEPGGAIRTFIIGPNNRVLEERVEEKDPSGGIAPRLLQHQTYEFDRRGRLISTSVSSFRDASEIAVPLITRYFYDRDDHLRRIVLPRGSQIQYEFDPLGRLEKTIDFHGNQQQFTYDPSGDLIETTIVKVENGAVLTNTHRHRYDSRGRLDRSEHLGSVKEVQYDDRDFPNEQRSLSTVTNRLQYNVFGQVTEAINDPDGLALRSLYDYDEKGRLRGYTDPAIQTTSWERDALGRTVAVNLPDGSRWVYQITTSTRMVEQQMPSGNRIRFEFEKQTSHPSRMVCIAAPGQEAVEPHLFVYDSLGRPVTVSFGPDSVLRQYDSLGRLTEETAQGKTVRMEYNDSAGEVDLVFPDGRRERQQHNIAGQPTKTLLITPGTLGGTANEVLLEIIYSTAGRPIRVAYGNGVEGQIAYDDRGRVIRSEYSNDGVLLDSCRLLYDETGHRAVIQHLGIPVLNRVHRFDRQERLVEVRQDFPLAALPDTLSSAAQLARIAAVRSAAGAAPGLSFTLDAADTRTNVTGLNGVPTNDVYVSSKDHRILAAGANAISYNKDGQRTSDGRHTYELDALNRVRRVRDRVTNAVIAELTYDGLSRVTTGATNGETFQRWFAGATRIQEVKGIGPAAIQQFTKHPLYPSPLCVNDGAGTAYVHQDEGWSTMCLTDNSGTVVERHRYDTFGQSATFGADGITPLAVFRTEPFWRGMPQLGSTPLYTTPNRIYDSETGVFTGRDPLLYFDSPSPHAFAAHNPVDFADPTGLAKSPLGETSPKTAGSNEQRTGLSKWFYENSKKVDWYFPPREGDLFTEIGPVDTGSTLENYLKNGLLITGGNIIKSFLNTPFEILNELDLAARRSPFQKEWEAVGVMGPMMKTMGLAIEAGPALQYLSTWMSTNRRLRDAAMAPVFLSTGAGAGAIQTGGTSGLTPLVEFENVGATPIMGEGNWVTYQKYATGTEAEHFFRVWRNGVKQPDVLADALTNSFIVDAKLGNMGQLWCPDRLAHAKNQAASYLEIADAFGYRGVRYAVSTEIGRDVLIRLFTEEFPRAMSSGMLSVWWVP